MAAVHTIKVPDVGEGIAQVELVAWHVAVGDTVAEDQPLADVMTDKANVEIPSPVAGRVLALGGEVGKMLAVGSELIRIETEGAQALAPSPAAAASVAAASTQDAAASAPVAAALPASAMAAPVVPIPATSAAPPVAQAPTGPADRPIASPAVRRRAWELGIDLHAIKASGTAGRITHADLDAAAAQAPPGARLPSGARAAPAAATPPAPPPVRPVAPKAHIATAHALSDDVQTIPVIGLRRRIAMQMQEAKRHIPHFSYVEELDVTEAEALRAALNQRWAETRGRLTLLPLLMRAMVLALREFPQVNARFDDEAGVISRHGAVHLGVATQTANGLLVPVVRQAQALDPWGLASEVSRLAENARAGRSTRAELSGSTITISSLGALGGIVSTPVINRPEVAIVGVNRIVERPVVRQGAIVTRLTMNLSSSFDHRVIDGDDAARFIQAVRARIETPALLFTD
jgi:2-oxoisovalerate dehydrogenase E2 component (dihydrolipoyl transacylase)